MQQRRRSSPHSFEQQLAAGEGPPKSAVRKCAGRSREGYAGQENQADRNGFPHQCVALVAGTAAAPPMKDDYLAQVEKLRKDAAECALIRDLATDKAKREMLIALPAT